MKIAVVGTGIAGNVAAYKLRDAHDITVYEANDYIGGHTNTVDVEEGSRRFAIDTGFIVFNDRTYPEFSRILEELQQSWRDSVMSFSVRQAASGLEYNGSTLDGLFAQRANMLRPRFLRMIGDILRFNRNAAETLADDAGHCSVGHYLEVHGYSREFYADYLQPMVAAIWSAEPKTVADMPLRFVVQFFVNHGLLQLKDRPQWRTIEGGSKEYVSKLVEGHRDRIRLSSPVVSVRRIASGVEVRTEEGSTESYDRVFLACHADQALKMLEDPTVTEREVLGSFGFQDNHAVLHTDERLLPSSRRAWAAWNYRVPSDDTGHVTVTYNMNILQGLESQTQYCVTLNEAEQIDPKTVLYETSYSHPIISAESVTAQQRHREVNTGMGTYYCGAYWRNGFHEDGVVSALAAIRHFEEEQRGELHFRRAS
ncbi:MAG: FAD-dependent oxidoreductase [Pseudomonadota bacterium]